MIDRLIGAWTLEWIELNDHIVVIETWPEEKLNRTFEFLRSAIDTKKPSLP